MGDLHLPQGAEPLSTFRALLMEVKSAEPDLVVLVGDYISHPTNIYELLSSSDTDESDVEINDETNVPLQLTGVHSSRSI